MIHLFKLNHLESLQQTISLQSTANRLVLRAEVVLNKGRRQELENQYIRKNQGSKDGGGCADCGAG